VLVSDKRFVLSAKARVHLMMHLTNLDLLFNVPRIEKDWKTLL